MRSELMTTIARLPAMPAAAVQHVAEVEDVLLQKPQEAIKTIHMLHAGLYSRTVMIPAGIQITGALIKIPTMVVVDGDAYVWLGDKARRIKGHAVLPASAGRKQMFRANKDTHITMIFATAATTVDEAEREFTDEWEKLASHRDPASNHVIVTGE